MLFHLFPTPGSAYQRMEERRRAQVRADKAARRKRNMGASLEKTLMGRKKRPF